MNDSRPSASGFRPDRALLVTLAVTLVLAAAAFWPAPVYHARPRPKLEPPIAFDALNTATLPQPRPPNAEPGR